MHLPYTHDIDTTDVLNTNRLSEIARIHSDIAMTYKQTNSAFGFDWQFLRYCFVSNCFHDYNPVFNMQLNLTLPSLLAFTGITYQVCAHISYANTLFSHDLRLVGRWSGHGARFSSDCPSTSDGSP